MPTVASRNSMNREIRFTINQEVKKIIDEDGYLVQFDVPIARSGEFIYRAYEFTFIEDDGVDPNQELRVYRSPNTFSEETLSKNLDIPFTNNHPSDGPVSIENAKFVRTGSVHGLYFKDDVLYASQITIYDPDTIEDIENKGKKEVSLGFQASYDLHPVTVDGRTYDGTEEVERINHLSLVDAGKAGPQYKMHTKEGKQMPTEKQNEPMTLEVMVNGVKVALPVKEAFKVNQANQAHIEKSVADMSNSMTQMADQLTKLIDVVNRKNEDEDKKDDSENEDNGTAPGKDLESQTATKNEDDDDKKTDSENGDDKKTDSENDDDEQGKAENKPDQKANAKNSVEGLSFSKNGSKKEMNAGELTAYLRNQPLQGV